MRAITLLLAATLTTACGDPRIEVAVHAGPAGADVAGVAASEIRQAGFLKDRQLEVRVPAQIAIVRNEVTPEMLSAAFDSLTEDTAVVTVISRFLGQETLAAARDFAGAGLPYLAVTPTPPELTGANGPGFSLVPGYAQEAQFMAAQATAADRVAVVHLNDAYGVSLANALVSALRARGMTPVDVRDYAQEWDEPRVLAVGHEVRARNPTLVYFIGRSPSLALVRQPLRESGDVRIIGSDLSESFAVYDNNEGAYTGIFFVRFVDPTSSEERVRELRERYLLWIGRGTMTSEAMLVYDAMLLIGDALRAGARSRAEMRAHFASLGRTRPAFEGVGGAIEFNEAGFVERKIELAEVTRAGVITVLKEN